MIFLNIGFWIVVATVALLAVVDLCLCISAYLSYRKWTLDHTYQKLNAKVIISTDHLFPGRYTYDRPKDNWLLRLTYTVVEPGGNKFFPNKKEYDILLNFIDYCRINVFISREESAKKRNQVSDRETNAVLEDLQKLTREEIEKAEREVDSAIADVKKHMRH